MKTKYKVLVIPAFFMILFFQNCGKAPIPQGDALHTGVVEANAPQYNKYSVDGYKTLSLWDVNTHRFLDLNLQTGEILAFEEAGQTTGSRYQLTEAQMTELRSILNSAEICEPIVKPEDLEGRVCTMQYHYPYATLMDQGEEVRLGEKTSGCDIPVDLCGTKAKDLKDWAVSTVSSLYL